MQADARQCETCGILVTPRGGLTPCFCPRCGEQLAGGPVPPGRRRVGDLQPLTPGGAVASLVFGILSLLIPMIGLILGIAAIAAGIHAKKRIEQAGGRLAGTNLATAGITLGIIGTALWTLVCAAAL